MPETLKAFAAEPYSYADVRAVAEAHDLSEPVAVTLVRRGYRTPELARAFLAADESHPAAAFDSIETIVAQVRAAIAAGERITVHGDFDVDGVCATTVMVSTLRELGAACDWLIPDRIGDGYGLSRPNIERLAERGTELLLTVDCGVTAVDEVRLARELGIETIVTDHHQAGEEQPDCPILHPELSGYPFDALCGTAVAWKLACALREDDGEEDLDLVALATVADVVPLVGENRALVKRGLAEMRRARRVGLRALMAAARCEPTRLDEGDLAFRLAPRINAAGRLYRADAGVELLLTEDEGRAEEIAAELGRANSERRGREREVDAAAEAARRELPDRLREASGLVLAGEDWHPGVVGIVASRLVERYSRPVVLIAGTDGDWKGSGRSVAGFDLHDGLRRCAGHLERWGGHAAAAGLSIKPENVPAFAEQFAAIGDATLEEDDLRPPAPVDAFVHGRDLTLELCGELARLAPFGLGNPNVTLLLPGCELADLTAVGEGKHLKFRVRADGRDSGSAIAFRLGRRLDSLSRPGHYDVAFRLEANQWNGTVAPQLNVRQVFECDDRYVELREWLKGEWRKDARDPAAAAIFEELALAEGGSKRHLLESERFLALLHEPGLARAA